MSGVVPSFERVYLHRETPTLEAVEKLWPAAVGGATNGWKLLDHLTAAGEDHDGVYRVSGWNGRIVDFVVHAERGDEAVETVRSWTPPRLAGD